MAEVQVVPSTPGANLSGKVNDADSGKNLDQLQKSIALINNYQRLLLVSVISAFVFIAIFVGMFIVAADFISSIGILPVVVLSGCMGAIFSSLIRLYGYTDLPALLVNEQLQGLNSYSVAIYSVIPILVGAIASAVLYLTFAGGLLAGSIFPKFDCVSGQVCSDLVGVVQHLSPENGAAYAKVIVWGFIAGFAERLVPDTIGSFVKAANSTAGKSAG